MPFKRAISGALVSFDVGAEFLQAIPWRFNPLFFFFLSLSDPRRLPLSSSTTTTTITTITVFIQPHAIDHCYLRLGTTFRFRQLSSQVRRDGPARLTFRNSTGQLNSPRRPVKPIACTSLFPRARSQRLISQAATPSRASFRDLGKLTLLLPINQRSSLSLTDFDGIWIFCANVRNVEPYFSMCSRLKDLLQLPNLRGEHI